MAAEAPLMVTAKIVHARLPDGDAAAACAPNFVLDLSGSHFVAVSATGSIGTAAAPLRKLSLANNALTRLSGLHELRHVTWLDASSNKLNGQALVDIAHMEQLAVLNCGRCTISSLPASALRAQAASLKALMLNDNRIQDISPLLALRGLNTLIVSHNRIGVLPPDLHKLAGLVKLSLSHNALKELPAGIGRLAHLAELRLNDNKLEALPACLQSCGALRVLDVGNNRIAGWAGLAALAGMPRLANLVLRGNPVAVQLPAAAASASAGGSTVAAHAVYVQQVRRLCPRLAHLDNGKLLPKADAGTKDEAAEWASEGHDEDDDEEDVPVRGAARDKHSVAAPAAEAPRATAAQRPHKRGADDGIAVSTGRAADEEAPSATGKKRHRPAESASARPAAAVGAPEKLDRLPTAKEGRSSKEADGDASKTAAAAAKRQRRALKEAAAAEDADGAVDAVLVTHKPASSSAASTDAAAGAGAFALHVRQLADAGVDAVGGWD